MKKQKLEACIYEYGTDIYSFCKYLANNSQEADDLYQDTFLTAMEYYERIDFEYNPKSYLLSIALRIWKNRKRKFAWRKRIADIRLITEAADSSKEEGMGFSPEEVALEREKSKVVRQTVNNLPERLKVIVLLYYMEELSIAQISEIIHIPVGTVKSRLYHARKILEKELELLL